MGYLSSMDDNRLETTRKKVRSQRPFFIDIYRKFIFGLIFA